MSTEDLLDNAITAAQARRDLLMAFKEKAPTFAEADNLLLRAQAMDDLVMVLMDVRKQTA